MLVMCDSALRTMEKSRGIKQASRCSAVLKRRDEGCLEFGF